MRIAQLLPYDADFHGGVREHVLHLSRELDRRGHRTTIFAPSAHATLELDFPRTVAIQTQPLVVPANGSVARVMGPDPWAWSVLIRTLLRERFDVIHLHEPMLWLPVLFTSTDGAALVGTFHASFELGEFGQMSELAKPATSAVLERLAATIAVSRAASTSAAAYGVQPEYLIPNGVDVSAFSGPAEVRADDERPTVLFFGRLEARKGLDTLLAALPTVARDVARLRLVVAGNFALEDDAVARARGRAAELGIELVIVPSPDDRQKIRLFKSATVFCAPALGGESFGIVLAEALAAGLPIVASDLPGFSEVLEEGRFGMLVPPGDAEGLGAALARLLNNAELQERFSRSGRERAGRFAWEVVAEQILHVYARVANSSVAPARSIKVLAA